MIETGPPPRSVDVSIMPASRPLIAPSPRHVECPACGAPRGAQCVTRSGEPTRVHKKRLAAQSEANRRQLSELSSGLDPHSFLVLAADSHHEWLCARNTGHGECLCLCVLARQLLERMESAGPDDRVASTHEEREDAED